MRIGRMKNADNGSMAQVMGPKGTGQFRSRVTLRCLKRTTIAPVRPDPAARIMMLALRRCPVDGDAIRNNRGRPDTAARMVEPMIR
jgi:hypothetical protein